MWIKFSTKWFFSFFSHFFSLVIHPLHCYLFFIRNTKLHILRLGTNSVFLSNLDDETEIPKCDREYSSYLVAWASSTIWVDKLIMHECHVSSPICGMKELILKWNTLYNSFSRKRHIQWDVQKKRTEMPVMKQYILVNTRYVAFILGKYFIRKTKKTIQNYQSKKQHPISQQIAQTLSSIDIDVVLCWIPSHSNIPKNDQADNFAKKSLLMSPIPNIPVPLTDLKNSLKSSFHDYWDQVPFCDKLKSMQPSIQSLNIPNTLSRKDQVILTRVRSGHSLLTHAHLLNKQPIPTCDTCLTPISTLHLLKHCPKYRIQRLYISPTLRKSFQTLPQTLSIFYLSSNHLNFTLFSKYKIV